MLENYPFFSIIIPTRNVQWCIERCLKSLREINYPKEKYEIIVADSDSEDDTRQIAKKCGAIIVSGFPKTISGCRNKGFRVAKGEFIAFTDADCIFDKNWLKNSLKYFNDRMVGGVGGINITPKDETAFGRAVGFILNQPIFSAGSVYARILNEVKEVKSIAGCNAIYRREVLEKVLPLDGNTLSEDYVMNQKIRSYGYKLLYTPDTIVWHYRRPTPIIFFKQMQHYAVCRLSAGRKNRKMINAMHILVGFGLPIFSAVSFALIYFNIYLFSYFVLLILIFLFFYFTKALIKLRSFKSALYVPYAIIILFGGWSLGFLKELFFPVKNIDYK